MYALLSWQVTVHAAAPVVGFCAQYISTCGASAGWTTTAACEADATTMVTGTWVITFTERAIFHLILIVRCPFWYSPSPKWSWYGWCTLYKGLCATDSHCAVNLLAHFVTHFSIGQCQHFYQFYTFAVILWMVRIRRSFSNFMTTLCDNHMLKRNYDASISINCW